MSGPVQAAIPGTQLPPKEPGRHRSPHHRSGAWTASGASRDARGEPCEADDEWTESMAADADRDGELTEEAKDALLAGVGLVGRTGATGFTVGHVNEPHEKPDWYAQAEYRGRRIIVEHLPGPVSATEALARRLLRNGTCSRCNLVVKLGGSGGKACRWWRDGRTWRRGCET